MLSQKKWIAESAGIDKSKEIDGYTRKMLEEKGFRVKERPEGMDEKDLDEFEVVVAVCDSACVSIPGKRVIKWNIPDPSGTSPENYRRVFSMLENKIRELLIELNDVD